MVTVRAEIIAPTSVDAAGLARSLVKPSTQVKDETHDRLTSTVSFWSSIGFYSLCSSSMLLVNKMVLARLPYASTLSLIQICAAVVFIQIGSYGNVLGVICVRPERRRREVCPRAPIPLARAALGTRPPAVGPRAV